MPVSRWRPWLLLAAPLTVIGVLLLWPIVRVTILSFQQYGLREVIAGRPTFVGLDNFREVLTGDYLWSTVLPNTLIFAFVAVVGTIVLGTLVALLLQQLVTWGRVVVIGSALVAWALPAVRCAWRRPPPSPPRPASFPSRAPAPSRPCPTRPRS